MSEPYEPVVFRMNRESFKVLDHGYVKYVAHLGGDESVVEAARMSTGRGFVSWESYDRCEKCDEVRLGDAAPNQLCNGEVYSHQWKKFPRGDNGVLGYMYSNKHMTPFEMCELVVEVKAPIFVFRELHRHRTFSINEMSARYTQMPNEHYVPELERFTPRATGNKQTDSIRLPADYEAFQPETTRENVRREQGEIYSFYSDMLEVGVPKEVARINTPVSRYSVMRWKANLRNWLQMLTLRDHGAAQWECQQTVKPVGQIVKALWPRTYALWEEHTKYAVTLSRSEVVALQEVLSDAKDGMMVKADRIPEKLR